VTGTPGGVPELGGLGVGGGGGAGGMDGNFDIMNCRIIDIICPTTMSSLSTAAGAAAAADAHFFVDFTEVQSGPAAASARDHGVESAVESAAGGEVGQDEI
jgi:hypothetical protein